MEHIIRFFASAFEVRNEVAHERFQKEFIGLRNIGEVQRNGPAKVGPCGHTHSFLRLYRHGNALTSLPAMTWICEQIC
jgi:hypothetical protein